MSTKKLLREKSRREYIGKMESREEARQEMSRLRKGLRRLREMGLYRGTLTVSKKRAKEIIETNRQQINTLTDAQKDLFRNKQDALSVVARKDRLASQQKQIDQIKDEYARIVSNTGLTGNRTFFNSLQATKSIRQNREVMADLRRFIFPLIQQANAIEHFNIDTSDLKSLRQQLKQLRKEGKVEVDLRSSKKKLVRVLADHLADQRVLEVMEQQNQQQDINLEDVEVLVRHSKSTFKGITRFSVFETTPELNSLNDFFAVIEEKVVEAIKANSNKRSIKMFYRLDALMAMANDPTNTKQIQSFESTKRERAIPIMHRSTENTIKETMSFLRGIIKDMYDDFVKNGSDWFLIAVKELRVHFAHFTPLQGGSFLPLPKCLNHKRSGLINIKNQDDKCWLYNNICHFHKPNHHKERVNHYTKYVDEFVTDGFSFPMTLDQIPKWDKVNNTRSFVFTPTIGKGGKLTGLEPIYVDQKNTDCPNEVCHLLIEDGKKYHFVKIDNFSALNPSTTQQKREVFFCYNCMTHFQTEEKRDRHVKESLCMKNECAHAKMPKHGNHYVEFKDFHHMQRLPFMFVFDIESDLVEEIDRESIDKKNTEHFLQQHVPNSICGYFYSDFGDAELKVFYGETCIQQFMDWMASKEGYIFEKMKQNEKMKLTAEDEKTFQKSKHCYLCKKPFQKNPTSRGQFKVRDHDHQTGDFRGACHSSCNLNFNFNHFRIPVVAHNCKGYDSQLIIREVSKHASKEGDFDAIPENSEKFISFNLRKYQFVDSMAFMSSSLETLTANLVKTECEMGEKQFIHLEKYFNGFSDEKIQVLKQKGIYPYAYANGKNRFDITHLPERKWFYDNLKQQDVSEEDYQRALKVFDLFECKTFQDYHDLYLITDVLLLSDVWEAFRHSGFKDSGLDPAWFYGLPGYTMAGYKKRVMDDGLPPVELLHDNGVDEDGDLSSTEYDKLLFFQEQCRGGLSQISHRLARANNKHCPNYDSSKPTTHISYIDANSLYPTVMSRFPLPHSKFEWGDLEEYTLERILSMDKYGSEGCVVKCDIEYPDELHDSHNDYPCAVENVSGDFSPLMATIAETMGYKLPKNKKLIANLNDKKGYVLDYRCLQLYVSLGLRVTKIHKVLTFHQSYSMKNYVDHMAECRKNSKNEFEKNYFKLCMNALFGKTIEDVRKYSNIKFCTDEKRASKYINSFRCKSWNAIGDDLLAVDYSKTSSTFSKPIFLGTSILDLSKYIMIDHHYNVIRKRYGDKAKLLFTDTDSLAYLIETEDVYADMIEDREHYDFSAYNKSDYIYSQQLPGNTKKLGAFKDEQAKDPIIEFCGRAPKEYSYITASGASVLKGKGVPSQILKKKCSHERAVKMINDSIDKEAQEDKRNFDHKVDYQSFRTFHHTIYTEQTSKTGMTILDNKRFVLNDGISTLAWGHKDIPQLKHD